MASCAKGVRLFFFLKIIDWTILLICNCVTQATLCRLVRVYGACTRDRFNVCLIMELLEGGNLFQRIYDRKKRRMSYLEILQARGSFQLLTWKCTGTAIQSLDQIQNLPFFE